MNHWLIEWLTNWIYSKLIPENKNLKKVLNIVKKILDFNKQQKGKGIKILSPKQMVQRLPVALVQVKYSLYREKEVTKKVYNNLMNSVKLYNRMDTIFMNYGNSETPDSCRVLLKLWDKINLKEK